MEAASIRDIKSELKELDHAEIMKICVRLANFKKENKELLTYLLFEAGNEEEYVRHIKEEMEEQFDNISGYNFYLLKKEIRKILRLTKKHIRFSKNKETEVTLLLFFCQKLAEVNPFKYRSASIRNIQERQIALIRRKLKGLHEDLQYDYGRELEELEAGKID